MNRHELVLSIDANNDNSKTHKDTNNTVYGSNTLIGSHIKTKSVTLTVLMPTTLRRRISRIAILIRIRIIVR